MVYKCYSIFTVCLLSSLLHANAPDQHYIKLPSPFDNLNAEIRILDQMPHLKHTLQTAENKVTFQLQVGEVDPEDVSARQIDKNKYEIVVKGDSAIYTVIAKKLSIEGSMKMEKHEEQKTDDDLFFSSSCSSSTFSETFPFPVNLDTISVRLVDDTLVVNIEKGSTKKIDQSIPIQKIRK